MLYLSKIRESVEMAQRKNCSFFKRKFVVVSFLSFFLFVVLFLLFYYYFYPRKKFIQENLEDEIIKKEKVTFLDNLEENFEFEYVELVSSGDIYEKELFLNDGVRVNLVLMKAYLKNKSPVNAVIALVYNEDLHKIPNIWLYNIDYSDPNASLDSKLKISYLKTIFSEGTAWDYFYYSDNEISFSKEYLETFDFLMKDFRTEGIPYFLANIEEYNDFILMPYFIREN